MLYSSATSWTPGDRLELLIAVLSLIALTVGVLTVLGWSIARAATLPAPAMLVASLSMLTYLAIIGSIVTGAAALETIAAAGVGALAAAVAHQFRGPGDPPG